MVNTAKTALDILRDRLAIARHRRARAEIDIAHILGLIAEQRRSEAVGQETSDEEIRRSIVAAGVEAQEAWAEAQIEDSVPKGAEPAGVLWPGPVPESTESAGDALDVKEGFEAEVIRARPPSAIDE